MKKIRYECTELAVHDCDVGYIVIDTYNGDAYTAETPEECEKKILEAIAGLGELENWNVDVKLAIEVYSVNGMLDFDMVAKLK